MKTGRNEPCPCGSGKKYKKCCLPSAHAIPVEDRSHVTDDAKAKLVRERIASVIGRPLQPLVPLGVALEGLSRWAGTLARLTLREPEELAEEIGVGIRIVPASQLERRVLRPEDTAPVTEAQRTAITAALVRIQLQRSFVKIGSHVWIAVLASMAGQVAGLLGRSAEDVLVLVRSGWSSTAEEAVAAFQASKRGVRQ